MKRPDHPIKRSSSMVIVAYFLPKCGERMSGQGSGPPRILGVKTWREAYDFFFDSMGDGRAPAQFRNSIRNARNTFDALFDNGRIGWIARKGDRSSLSERFRRTHEEWKDRPDEELEAFVLAYGPGHHFLKSNRLRSDGRREEGLCFQPPRT